MLYTAGIHDAGFHPRVKVQPAPTLQENEGPVIFLPNIFRNLTSGHLGQKAYGSSAGSGHHRNRADGRRPDSYNAGTGAYSPCRTTLVANAKICTACGSTTVAAVCRSCSAPLTGNHGIAPLVAPLRPDMAAIASRKHRVQRALSYMVFGTIGLTTLTACSSFRQEVAEFQAGWRTAKVTAVGKANEIESLAFTDCRKSASKEQLANSRFAVLSYRKGGTSQHSHIVILNDQTVLTVGDTVYANVENCGAFLEVRSRQQAG